MFGLFFLIKDYQHLSSSQDRAKPAKLAKPSPIWARSYVSVLAILSTYKLIPPSQEKPSRITGSEHRNTAPGLPSKSLTCTV